MTVCLADIERRAAQRVPAAVWDFVTGGSGDERLLRANRSAFDEVALLPRLLRGIGAAATDTTLLGRPAAMPVAVAPMAYQKLLHAEGELAAARAAAAAGVPFTVSTLSSCPVEEIAETGADLWFQLYWLRDRELMADIVRRAEAAGCRALVLTADVPIMARRRRDLRNEFTLPADVHAVHLAGGSATEAHRRRGAGSAVAVHTGVMFDPTLTWSDLGWLRERTEMPLVVKGILHPQDAGAAIDAGAGAVVVSNHGGRQFDGAPAAVAALPGVVAEVAGRAEVLLDSGVRTGTDVLRAIALGADGVLLGRPVLWGLAVDDVGLVLSTLRTELVESLVLTGCAELAAARELATVGAT
ncbi:alpha-hydroxy acid oxidase [Kutzneria sp. CA-103260]|uniref:alpha-hydroxy acid oxidase n=1 Tax=Kutzneria sp. CA-103260 TaxID=2802641 RepID=UPI001BAB1E25|nr:alpha-hydroxy acid oxidase [Kutzneria sp. CA-103260]QUQ67053.1 (S)-2-hydroxy-acid oxidase [Kutzneria sp. CA-103260]